MQKKEYSVHLICPSVKALLGLNQASGLAGRYDFFYVQGGDSMY